MMSFIDIGEHMQVLFVSFIAHPVGMLHHYGCMLY